MDDVLQPRLLAMGVLTARQVNDLGVNHHRLLRLVRDGELVRVRAGVYVDGARHRSADPVARHLLEVRAVLASLGAGYAAGHLSGVVVSGLPVLERDLGPVELVGIETGKARTDGRLRVHPAVPASVVVGWDGIAVVRPAVAVLQAAATTGLRAGLVAADAALHRRLITPGELQGALTEAPLGRRRSTAEQVVRLADGRSESPGESWARLLFHQLGLANLEPQAVIHDEAGRFVARVDLLDREHHLVIEFDGALKYAGGGSARRRWSPRNGGRTRSGGSATGCSGWCGPTCSTRPGCSGWCGPPSNPVLHRCNSSPGWGQTCGQRHEERDPRSAHRMRGVQRGSRGTTGISW